MCLNDVIYLSWVGSVRGDLWGLVGSFCFVFWCGFFVCFHGFLC